VQNWGELLTFFVIRKRKSLEVVKKKGK